MLFCREGRHITCPYQPYQGHAFEFSPLPSQALRPLLLSIAKKRCDTRNKHTMNHNLVLLLKKQEQLRVLETLSSYLAASVKAVLITLTGSMIPAFTISTYEPTQNKKKRQKTFRVWWSLRFWDVQKKTISLPPLEASKPKLQSSCSNNLPTTKEPS